MSYDIALFRPIDGESMEAAYRRLCEVDFIDDPNPGPIVPEIEELKERAAQELVQALPTLTRFELNYAGLAASHHIDEQEARRRWRHIELNAEEFGLQVTISDHNVSITFPYFHEEAQAG